MKELETATYETEDLTLIRGSSLADMFDNPASWYDKYVLGNNEFRGNTNTVLGTLIHGRIERFYKGEDIDLTAEQEWLDKNYKNNVEVNAWEINDNLDPMWEAWKEDYAANNPVPDDLEKKFEFIPQKGFLCGGTVDAIEGDTIIDWKTTTKKKSALGDYKFQLYFYAWLARKNGLEVNNVRIVFIQRKTSKLPARIWIADEPIDDEFMTKVIDMVKLNVKAVKLAGSNPELKDVLFRQNPLSFRQ